MCKNIRNARTAFGNSSNTMTGFYFIGLFKNDDVLTVTYWPIGVNSE